MKNLVISKLYNMINSEKQHSIQNCIDFLNKIWSADSLIQHYTDHALGHSFRILELIEKFPKITESGFLDEDEIYALLLGIFLHDIGMQCDIRKQNDIMEIAVKEYGANFCVEYSDKDGQLSKQQQEELRINHHLLTAAWLHKAFAVEEKNILGTAIEKIPHDIFEDIIDICKYHSKLSIFNCAKSFKHKKKLRKQLIATILRLGDELDINRCRVKLSNATEFSMPIENSIHYYLHHNTIVDIVNNSIIIYTLLLPEDNKKYGDFIIEKNKALKSKNQPLLDILINNQIPITFDSISVRTGNFAKKLPSGEIDAYMKRHKEMSKVWMESTKLLECKINILITGAAGCGKSSTINALFDTQTAKISKIKIGTREIKKYTLNNLTIWDTPGMGDGPEEDKVTKEKLTEKLLEKDNDGKALIDLILIILDGSSRDLTSTCQLINEVIIPILEKDTKRILVAINKADIVAMGGRGWDYENSKPNPKLQGLLDEKVLDIHDRIKNNTKIDVDEPIYYSAGFTEDDDVFSPYNLSKLMYFILAHTPKQKRLIYFEPLSKSEDAWKSNDNHIDYNKAIDKSFLDVLDDCMERYTKKGTEIGERFGGEKGAKIGEFIAFELGIGPSLLEAGVRKIDDLIDDFTSKFL